MVRSLRFWPSSNWSTLVTTGVDFADDEDVGAEIEYLLRDVAVDAVDERHHGNHRGYADHHAEQGQHGA